MRCSWKVDENKTFITPRSSTGLNHYFIRYLIWDICKQCKKLVSMTRKCRGGSRISRKGFICINIGGRFADYILFFSNIPWKRNNLVSLRPNYFICVGYFVKNKIGGIEGGSSELPEVPSGSATEMPQSRTITVTKRHRTQTATTQRSAVML